MPSARIVSQYARRARIVRGSTRQKTNSKFIGAEIFPSEEMNNGDETNTDNSSTVPTKKPTPRFLKLLIILFLSIMVLGLVAHIITKRNLINSEEDAQLIQRQQVSGISNNNNNSSLIMETPNKVYGKEVKLPSVFSFVTDVIVPMSSFDVPMFWHIPRSGGSALKEITALCLMLTQASQVGGFGTHANDSELQVIEDVEGGKYMNVDTSSPKGIDRARALNLASSPDLDIIVTPYVHLAAKLFSDTHRGRLFTLFRHPIERAVSMYYEIKTNPKTKSKLEDVSLENYAKSNLAENNWMTRFLTNRRTSELTPEIEAVAKEVLRKKILIGLLKYKDKSFERFERYFGWKLKGEKAQSCHERLLDWDWPLRNNYPLIQKDSHAWKLLETQNSFDLRLYDYAETLFHEQESLFHQQDESITNIWSGSMVQPLSKLTSNVK